MPDQCKTSMATGGQCDLAAGHDGKHRKTYTVSPADSEPYTRTFEWTDDDTKRFIEQHSSRFD